VNNKSQKRLFLLMLIAVPAFIAEIWAAYYYYCFYQTGHASLSLTIKAIILPAFFWSLIFIFTFIAWKRKWHWYVLVPIITTYPWMYSNFNIVLFSKWDMTGQLYWTVMLYSWSKVVFYMSAIVASAYYVGNKIRQKNKSA